MLAEKPLSRDQAFSEPDADGWEYVSAAAPNDQQTLWWIQGFGANIEVLTPFSWREHVLQHAKAILARA